MGASTLNDAAVSLLHHLSVWFKHTGGYLLNFVALVVVFSGLIKVRGSLLSHGSGSSIVVLGGTSPILSPSSSFVC